MPANLTQQYLKAEQEFRRAATPAEALQCLQVMLRELPKHKGTDKLQADLKARISQTRREVDAQRTAKKKTAGLRIPRQGAGRVILLGPPNSGKSQFVARTTRAEPEVAHYPFTTREPSLAMMPFEDVKIQLIDTPPITADVFDPVLQGLIRGSDLVLLFLDLGCDEGWEQCCAVLERLGQTKTRLAATSYLDENDIGLSFTRAFLVPNKIDLVAADLRWQLFQESELPAWPHYPISAARGDGLPLLQQACFEALDVVRIYTKTPTDKAADFTNPYTLPRGSTVADFATLVHKDFAERLKFARVWSAHVHPGTAVKADYEIRDQDIIELHM